MYKNVLE